MNKKIFVVMALFALLVVGTVFVAVPNEAKTVEETGNVYTVDDAYTVMAAGCTRVCSWCLKLGRNGACTTSGACC